MAAQRGKDVLLQMQVSGGGFETVGGVRTTALSLNARTVDATNASSPDGWRELIGGAGVRQAAVTGAGVFVDDAAAEAVRAAFFAGSVDAWRIVLPDFGIIEGPFQVAALDYGGEYAGEATMSISLASAGRLVFSAQ
ncbi:MAG: phage major tail protein, TP901-1 family [Pseudomonadota bacterium]